MDLPHLENLRAKPEAILAEIDNWSKDNKILMSIGQDRGKVITDLIENTKPKVMVELGGYIGYSAIKFGNAVRNVGGTKYLSFEHNAEWASVATKLIELAGLQNFVTIILGPSSESLMKLGSQNLVCQIDILFIDHAESLYRKDLEICERQGLLALAAHVVADNTSSSRAQDYVDWVMRRDRSSSSNDARIKVYESKRSFYRLPDGQTVSTLLLAGDIEHVC